MQALRMLFAGCFSAIGCAVFLIALSSLYQAAVVLFSYDEVDGVVTGVNGHDVWVEYAKPDGRKGVLGASGGGKFNSRPIGKKVAVLLPPRDRTDRELAPLIKDDLNQVGTEFMIAIIFLMSAASIWQKKSGERSGGSPKRSSEGVRMGLFHAGSEERERQERLNASIDLEIAERNAKRQKSGDASKARDQ